ncbi:cryptochrome/photolyase family protein [Sphingomonas jatrophae]|uniref:Deoxyribodipyrimidine photo-lyase n=1 Tax=Sphingomonas jatrophae TaxID=1166337 RepID=A0A1I6M3E4_9SPHN|nr:deoxyribodipyrimidine photo-lyase [Sphingomonas jatrophae]SFS10206.1 deoxyribodipyrimidine photo-lyase [Sphingomonas jatrophae]
MPAPTLVWFRQDLRLADQPALVAAAGEGPVVACYILDDETPGRWAIGGAQRWWLHHSLASLAADLSARGVELILRRGRAAEQVARLADEIGAARIHALAHYEPWWQAAEKALGERLMLHDGARLADPRTILTRTGGRYRIFTPFWRALAERMPPPAPSPVPDLTGAKVSAASDRLEDWVLLPTKPDWATGFDWTPGEAGARDVLEAFMPGVGAYATARNLPSVQGSSRLSPYLHMGELSPATVWHTAAAAGPEAEPFLRELGWRDFTANLLDLIPNYADAHGRVVGDRIAWRSDAGAKREYRAWTKGRTGYPIVDAGMRQLWVTGWMHNRVRMIAASFLVKHLLIDWRRGQDWFWDTLVDADLGNNAVNWQWVAGTGVDSSPFSRIMAPLVQSAKFDAAAYIRAWVPELADVPDAAIHDPHGAGVAPAAYPRPLIGHREGRERALAAARG